MKPLAALLLMAVLPWLAGAEAEPPQHGLPVPTVGGDRLLPTAILYPPAVFSAAGGRVIDLTREPYLAKGDGIADDTAAFVRVMDFLRDELAAGRAKKNDRCWKSWVYLPAGTYLVSDTLMHSGPPMDQGGFCGLNLVGQDRAKTTIRLRDHAPGFTDAEKPKAVLSWFEDWSANRGSNVAWGNSLRNLTVDTGSGNPGAIGVAFVAANEGFIDGLTVRSGDGLGHVGLYFPTWSIQGLMRDISVSGFSYGIRLDPGAEACPTIEHATLRDQRVAGIWVGSSCPVLRDVDSRNHGPGLVVAGAGAQVVLIDSRFAGDGGGAAIELRQPDAQHLFARGVNASGYRSALVAGATTLPAGTVVEFTSRPAMRLSDASPLCSLDLPIAEAPPVPWPATVDDWAVVPADADVAAVQAILDSGKPAIVFQGARYRGKGDLRVPKTVRLIDLLAAEPFRNLQVDEDGGQPLWVVDPGGRMTVVQRCARTLVMHGGTAGYSCEAATPARAFLESLVLVAGEKTFCPPTATIWARSINDENRQRTVYTVDGGTLWVLGHKTEAAQTSFAVRNGGILEVLGGYRNRAAIADLGRPQVFNDGGNLSFIGFCSMSRIYQEAVWEQRGGELRKLARADLPRRGIYPEDFFIPLFCGFDAARLPRPPRGLAPAAAR